MAVAFAVQWYTSSGIRYSLHQSQGDVTPFFNARNGPDGLMRIDKQWSTTIDGSVMNIVKQSDFGIYVGERPR